MAGGIVASNIAKWDGTDWSALGSGIRGGISIRMPDPSVYALAVLGEDLYVGGGFIFAGDVPVWSIAKWNGSVWSSVGSGVPYAPSGFGGTSSPALVYSLAVSGDKYLPAAIST